ncbi:MAG: hypothetical protein J7L69_10805 [Desulfobulbaceae bacterium]|nr:hypothetical protein [Desulfobulbaceae bacterium]
MKLTIKVLVAGLLIVLMSLSAHAADKAVADKKPMVQDADLVTIEATVEKIDRKSREVTLKGKEGKSVTFSLNKEAGKLDEIEVGDLVTIDYLEAVTIQVFGPDEIEPGVSAEEVVVKSEPGEKPAGLAAGQVSVVVTIEAIDLEKERVTLKSKDGQLKTVKPRHPENLKKVKVGDMVKITYTKAVGFSVTEKPAVK